jgi:flavoprotein
LAALPIPQDPLLQEAADPVWVVPEDLQQDTVAEDLQQDTTEGAVEHLRDMGVDKVDHRPIIEVAAVGHLQDMGVDKVDRRPIIEVAAVGHLQDTAVDKVDHRPIIKVAAVEHLQDTERRPEAVLLAEASQRETKVVATHRVGRLLDPSIT